MDRKERQFPCAGMLRDAGCTRGELERLSLKTGVAAVLFPVVFLLAACSPAADDPAASSAAPARVATIAPPNPAQAAARMQECRAKLEAGIPLGLVVNASVDNGRPILWVGPAWQKSTREAKESLARETACFFLSGDESKTIKFSIYEQTTDREVAVWNLSRLIEW
jgi:hypothetical protein